MPPTTARKAREKFGKLRHLPSGRWQASYLHDGERHTAPQTFATDEQGRAWLNSRRALIDSGQHAAVIAAEKAAEEAAFEAELARLNAEERRRMTPTFGEYANRWVNTRRGGKLKASTRYGYTVLQQGPLVKFSAQRLDKIRRDEIAEWYAEQVKTGHHTRANRALKHLKAVLATAVKDGHIESNPCTFDSADLVKDTGIDPQPPTRAQVDTIVAAIDERYRALVAVAAWGSLRWGEVTSLRVSDVEIIREAGRIVAAVLDVSRAVAFVPHAGHVVDSTKNGTTRPVVIPAHAAAHLAEHLATFGPNPPTDALLFHSATDWNKHLSNPTFFAAWDKARAAAERPDLHFHSLRQFGAIEFAKTGATLREQMDRMGHKTATMTLHYQRGNGERQADLVALMR